MAGNGWGWCVVEDRLEKVKNFQKWGFEQMDKFFESGRFRDAWIIYKIVFRSIGAWCGRLLGIFLRRPISQPFHWRSGAHEGLKHHEKKPSLKQFSKLYCFLACHDGM